MANDDTLALTALLSLSGSLLSHRAQIQNIKTTAMLDRDKMEFEAAQFEKEKDYEYKKSVFQIQMNDI